MRLDMAPTAGTVLTSGAKVCKMVCSETQPQHLAVMIGHLSSQLAKIGLVHKPQPIILDKFENDSTISFCGGDTPKVYENTYLPNYEALMPPRESTLRRARDAWLANTTRNKDQKGYQRSLVGPVPNTAHDGVFQIFLKGVSGKTSTYYCSEHDPIKSLNTQIAIKTGIPMEEQRLIHAGKPMSGERSIGSYGISHGSTVHLLLRLRGGGGIVKKLHTGEMPRLKESATTPEDFVLFNIEMKSWAARTGASEYIIGPLPKVPDPDVENDVVKNQAEIDTVTRANAANTPEGLQYLCAAIENVDLCAAVADAAEGNGPKGYAFLKNEFLPTGSEQPATQRLLDSTTYDGSGNVLAFRNKFNKLVTALDPKPAEETLCIRFTEAISKNTGGSFDSCITSASATGDREDFDAYSRLLCRLCAEKSALTAKVVNQRDALVTALRAEVRDLREDRHTNRPPRGNRPPKRDERDRPAPRKDKKPGDRSGDRPAAGRTCPRCGKKHSGGLRACKAPKEKCNYRKPDGTLCNGDHLRRLCFLEDPSRCEDARFRATFEEKKKELTPGRVVSGRQVSWGDASSDEELFLFTELDGCITSDWEDQDDVGMEHHQPDCDSNGAIADELLEAETEVSAVPEAEIEVSAILEAEIEIPALLKAEEDISANAQVRNQKSRAAKAMMDGGQFYVDTGASGHVINDPRLITDPAEHVPCTTALRTGNATTMATSKGPARFTVLDVEGKEHQLVRTAVFCPAFRVNLFSPQADRETHGTSIEFNDVNELTFKGGLRVPFSHDKGNFLLSFGLPETQCHAIHLTAHQTQVPSSKMEIIRLWHRRLGHHPFAALQHVPQTSVGMPNISISADEISKLRAGCNLCPLASMKACPHKRNKGTGVKLIQKFGDRIDMDLCGPINPPSFQHGYRYCSLFVDAHTLFMAVYFLRSKDEHIEAHKRFCAELAPYGGQSVKEFHSDNGGEFTSQEYIDLLVESGAKQSTIIPRTPNQNPIAEGAFWRIFCTARALLKQSGMPNEHWATAVAHACYILNRTPKKRRERATASEKADGSTASQNGWITPYELLTGRVPNLAHLRTYGCMTQSLIHKTLRKSKLSDLAEAGYYVGKCRTHRGHRLYIPGKGKYISSRNIKFTEETLYKDKALEEKPTPPVAEAAEEGASSDEDEEEPTEPKKTTGSAPTRNGCRTPGCNLREFHMGNHSNQPVHRGMGLPSAAVLARRPERSAGVVANHHYLTEADEAQVCEMHSTDVAEINEMIYDGLSDEINAFASRQKTFRGEGGDEDAQHTFDIPRSHAEAMRSEYHKEWQTACEDEIRSHDECGTWKLVPRSQVPKEKKIIGSTWAFDLKRNKENKIDRHKSRLCAQGFSQVAGFDYFRTYSNTVRYDTLRLVLAISARKGYHLSGADIKTAYLNSTIDDDLTIYMRQPKGFEKTGPKGEEMVCLLQKAIYGLKQSGARWEARLVQYLLGAGFERCDVDPCLYLLRRNGETLLLVVYVDDLIMATSTIALRQEVVSDLTKNFKLKDTGDLDWVFGTSIVQSKSLRRVSLHQTIYIDNLVDTYLGDKDRSGKERVTPCNDEILVTDPLKDGETIHPEYRTIVGKLGWLSLISRPDIAYAYNMLAKFASAGTPRHFRLAQAVVKYLKRTRKYEIRYGEEERSLHIEHVITGTKSRCDFTWPDAAMFYTDATYGGERPMGGYTGYYEGGPFAWSAFRLPLTPLSSSESELIAAIRAITMATSTGEILRFLGLGGGHPLPVLCDNLATVLLSENNTTSKRMKHIATRIAFLRENVEAKKVILIHVGTTEQIADIFTKPLAASPFHALREMMVRHPTEEIT